MNTKRLIALSTLFVTLVQLAYIVYLFNTDDVCYSFALKFAALFG